MECSKNPNLGLLSSENPGEETRSSLLGWFQGFNLPGDEHDDSFNEALVLNQLGPQLADEWFGILRHTNSGRDLNLALDGVFHMPENESSLDHPWREKIALALKIYGQKLEMFGRTLSEDDARQLLDRIGNRLTKMLAERRRVDPAG